MTYFRQNLTKNEQIRLIKAENFNRGFANACERDYFAIDSFKMSRPIVFSWIKLCSVIFRFMPLLTINAPVLLLD